MNVGSFTKCGYRNAMNMCMSYRISEPLLTCSAGCVHVGHMEVVTYTREGEGE